MGSIPSQTSDAGPESRSAEPRDWAELLWEADDNIHVAKRTENKQLRLACIAEAMELLRQAYELVRGI